MIGKWAKHQKYSNVTGIKLINNTEYIISTILNFDKVANSTNVQKLVVITCNDELPMGYQIKI